MQKFQGVSLIELLISLFILSLLLLGFDAMQIYALRAMKAAYYFSVAQEQLKGMMERIKIFGDASYADQFMIWNKQNSELLPQGIGMINKDDSNLTLLIMWGGMSECHQNKIGQKGCIRVLMVSR